MQAATWVAIGHRMYPVDSFLCLTSEERLPYWVSRDELLHLGYADEIKAHAAMPEALRQARLAKAKEESLANGGEHFEPEEMSSRDIQSAVRLDLPGELAKHAVSEGVKAVTKWTSASVDPAEPQRFSQSAGLQFPVALIGYDASRFSRRSLSIGAAVYLSAVCEYVRVWVDGSEMMVSRMNPSF